MGTKSAAFGSMKIHEFLNKPMDRRTFLRYIATGFLAIAGVLNILKYISKHEVKFLDTKRVAGRKQGIDANAYAKQTKGYGSSKYGS